MAAVQAIDVVDYSIELYRNGYLTKRPCLQAHAVNLPYSPAVFAAVATQNEYSTAAACQ